MPPLPTGSCDTCSAEDEKLRTNPFTNEEQCENCRNTSIIGIIDIKSRYKLKDDELKGLKMVTEAKEAFLGGPDRRWYLVEEVEKRAEEQDQKKEAAQKEKETAKKEKEAQKEAAKKEKELAKQEKEAAKKEKAESKKSAAAAAKDVKRKRDTEPGEKEADEAADIEIDQPAKRGRGRPAGAGGPKPKKPVANADGPKRGRGRPPKAK